MRYLYIDDAEKNESETFANAIANDVENLIIDHIFPEDYESIVKFLSDKKSNFDGLILDLRLDDNVVSIGDVKRKVFYKAPAVAQEIRNRMSEKRELSYPIILLSYNQLLKKNYRKDLTSHDLFDLILKKDQLVEDKFKGEIGEKLISLVQGYETIRENLEKRSQSVKFIRFLGFDQEEDAAFISQKILERFNPKEKYSPYIYAQFVIKHLLDSQGPLIDSDILHARLGVKRNQSSERLIAKYFDIAKYEGVFSSGWHRWWESKIEEIWSSQFSKEKALRTLNANERHEILNNVTKIDGLEVATPINESYSGKFWTVCQHLRQPLDPWDGLLIKNDHSYPWQSPVYASFHAYVGRLISSEEIDPIDRKRLEMLKRQYAKQSNS